MIEGRKDRTDEPSDPRARFSGAAKGYARFRPGYPDALVDWVAAEADVRPGDRVADVGCGTGILTRMLAQARAAGGGADYRRGDAEATGLDERSVALVTVAQAFHWFDLYAALDELHRILGPDGHAAALWNVRGKGAFMAAYDALLRRFSSEYRVLESGQTTLARLKRHPRVDAHREHWETHAQRFDLEGLQGRAWSSSYVRRGIEDHVGFDTALRTLFETHAHDGTVDFPYRTVALVFRIRPAPGRTS